MVESQIGRQIEALHVGQLRGQPKDVAIVDDEVVLAEKDVDGRRDAAQVVRLGTGRAVDALVLFGAVVEGLERLAGHVVLDELHHGVDGRSGRSDAVEVGQLGQGEVARVEADDGQDEGSTQGRRQQRLLTKEPRKVAHRRVVVEDDRHAEVLERRTQFDQRRTEQHWPVAEVARGHRGRQGDHDVDLVVEIGPALHGDVEDGAAQRVADVAQLRTARRRQHVVDDGRYVVLTHLVPSAMT